MWWWVTALSGSITPLFIILSPILSYGDQAHSMHKAKSSAGFSLDIPLIMLVASLLRLVAPQFQGPDCDSRLQLTLEIQQDILLSRSQV